MMYRVTEEEFKQLHNGKFLLHMALRDLRELLNESKFQVLEAGIKKIEDGMAGIYEQEEKMYRERKKLISQ